MTAPGPARSTRRTAAYSALLAALIIIPAALGVAVARAGATKAPPPAEQATFEPSLTTGPAQPQAVDETPLAEGPSTVADALIRGEARDESVARIQYALNGGNQVGLDNGGAIPLADDLEMAVTLSPYPPDDFNIDVRFDLTRGGVPVDNAQIDTVWDMIVMGHGPFDTRIPNVGGSTYEASFYFFMFGPWQLDAVVNVPGRDPIDFSLDVYVWPA